MPQTKQKYFPAIDGLRTICVTLVILDHASGNLKSIASMPFWLGVDIFFLISGFIITALLLREEDETGKIDLFAFYVRRWFRIVPIYLTVLAGYFLGSIRDPLRLKLLFHYIWYYLFFCVEITKTWAQTRETAAPFGISWSLGVEEKFYLVWPLAYFVIAPRRWRLLALPVLVALVLPLNKFWMTRSYIGLLMGCALAILLHGNRLTWLKEIMRRTPSFVPVLLLAACFYLVWRNWTFVVLFDLAGVFLLGSLLLRDSSLSALLSTRPFVWLGQRSYAMYLLHIVSLDAVNHFVRAEGSAWRTALTVLLTLAVAGAGASITRICIEEPSRNFARHWLARRTARLKKSQEPAPALSGTNGGA